MTDLNCPECGKKLGEAKGDYHISINCRRCKKIVELRSSSHVVEQSQHPHFEDMIAQTS